MKNYKSVFIAIIIICMISPAFALDAAKQNRLTYGHVMVIENFQTDPAQIIPGNPSQLKFTIDNSGLFPITDLRVKLELPSDLSFYNDVSIKKLSGLLSDEKKEIVFNILSTPDATEGIKKASIVIDYVDQAGEDNEENYSIGIIVNSKPNIFADIETSNIYQSSPLGDVTLTFYNNNPGNLKFLTVELQDSSDYQIISNSKKYIGALDSDDYQSTTFRLKVNDKKTKIELPLVVTYRDSLNNEYKEDIKTELYVRSASDLGIQTRNTLLISAVVLLIIFGIIYYFYRKSKKKKNHKEDY